MPERHAVTGAEVVLEHVAERARAHVEDHRDVVDVDDSGERAQVEHDPAVQRDARAADAAASGGRRDRHARLVAHREHARHLVDLPRPDDDAGQPWHLAVERPAHGQRPPVASRLGARRRVGGDVVADAPQPGQQPVIDLHDSSTDVAAHRRGAGGEEEGR